MGGRFQPVVVVGHRGIEGADALDLLLVGCEKMAVDLFEIDESNVRIVIQYPQRALKIAASSAGDELTAE